MVEKERKTTTQEKYPDLDIKISKHITAGETFTVINSEGEDVLRYEIFGIGPGPVLSRFNLYEDPRFKDEKHYMFGSTMGYPDTASIQIPDEL